ncbi:hypothetical protein C8R44DRAFT_740279 [Mycena epipterygia]|nr:hypothetical protein C8R44DRAFT_740279 [Mycena epipterygia]
MLSAGLCGWLMHPFCPFDFSGLQHLFIGPHTDLLVSDKFAPALQTIQTQPVHVSETCAPAYSCLSNDNYNWDATLENLDSHLSNLPLSPIVEFELHSAEIMPNLPLSRSKNMLRRADSDGEWFKRLTGML